MKKKIIFTTISLGLVTLLGFGFLGAINSQPKEAKASEITTQPTKKYKKVTTEDSFYNNPNPFYIVAKNYDDSGKGVFYTDSINIANSAVLDDTYTQTYAEFTMIRETDLKPVRMNFSTTLYNQQYRLNYCAVYDNSQNLTFAIYSANSTGGNFWRSHCAFIGKNFRREGTETAYHRFYFRIDKFFDIYELTGDYFEFIDNFNFNAWYRDTGNYSPMLTNVYPYQALLPSLNIESAYYTASYKVPLFFSNGLAFDTIEMHYDTANTLSFEWNGQVIVNNLAPNPANSYMTYNLMKYKNSATNFSVIVNRRDSLYMSSVNGTLVKQDTTWLDENYKTIRFFDTINEVQKTFFNATRNNVDIGDGFYQPQADIGLGNAFSLIGQAFTAWLPILQVTIVPGITLGLLLFLPLIAGIVIFIIWIVKR